MKIHYLPRSRHKRSKMRKQKKIKILRKTRRRNWKRNHQPRLDLKKMKRKRIRIHQRGTTKISRINPKMLRKIKSLRREVRLKKRRRQMLSPKKKRRFLFHKLNIVQCVMPISCP